MKLLTVVGARPQFVKAATVSREIAKHTDIQEVIVHTGQHYDSNMSDVFFEELEIPKPHYNLRIGGGSHGAMTGRMLEAIETVLQNEAPDFLLVYGDTNSTLAGAIAAVKLHIPVAHVEAGLRSFDRTQPEELNRIMVDHASDILFPPTDTGLQHLLREGIDAAKTRLVGDVMYDAALHYRNRATPPAWFDRVGLEPAQYILATVHRAANTDSRDKLNGILEGLAAADYPVILPLHPRTAARIAAEKISVPPRINIVEPVSYLEMVWLISNAGAVATDSGGLQKEAYFFGKRAAILDQSTGWVELAESGWNILCGTEPLQIKAALRTALSQPEHSPQTRPFGDGDAAKKILEGLRSF